MVKRGKQGKAFEKEIRLSIQKLSHDEGLPIFFHRFEDYRSAFGVKKKIQEVCGEKIHVPKQPSDWFILIRGVAHLLEAKSCKKNASFPVRHCFDPEESFFNQLAAMRLFTKCGGMAEILICRRKPRANEMYVFTIKEFDEILKKMKRQKRMSIKWRELDSLCADNEGIKVETKNKKIWDMGFLVTMS